MSIIYDALKKVEDKNNNQNPEERITITQKKMPAKINGKKLILPILCAACVVFFIISRKKQNPQPAIKSRRPRKD